MAATVTAGSIYKSLKRTLDRIMTDKTDGVEAKVTFPKYCKVKDMEDAWEEDQEYAGMGLISLKDPGGELETGTIKQGYAKRYNALTYGLKAIVTEEALEDEKYSEVIKMAKRLKRATWKTCDYLAVTMLARAENANYPGGDGVPLASTSHPLAQGGTWSNTMAVPMTPSVQAVTIARAAMMRFPSQDGTIEVVEPEKVVCTADGWGDWFGLTKSDMDPRAGNYAEINVVKGLNLEVVVVPYWTNTTSNYCFITDHPDGLQWRWKRRPRGRSWMENDNETMKYSNSMRCAFGWSDPRGVYFVGA